VLPGGAFAKTITGSNDRVSWEIEWPTTVTKDKGFNINVTTRSLKAGEVMYSTYLLSPPPSTSAESSICPTGPYSLFNCGGANPCVHSYACSWPTAESRSFIMRLSTSYPDGSTDSSLLAKDVSFAITICEGTICFENPISSLTFWDLFNRIMGFALVIGLAIAPIVLLY